MNSPIKKPERVLVKVTLNFKISISSYPQLFPHSSRGTTRGLHSVATHSPQPSAIYTVSPNQLGTVQSQLLATR